MGEPNCAAPGPAVGEPVTNAGRFFNVTMSACVRGAPFVVGPKPLTSGARNPTLTAQALAGRTAVRLAKTWNQSAT